MALLGNRARPIAAATLLVVLLLQASTLLAKPRPAIPASAADELFEQGKAALKLGDWNSACEKFRQSHALDASASALIKIARCHEHDRDATSAWESYAEASALLAARNGNDTHTDELLALIRSAQAELTRRYGRLRLLHAAPVTDLAISVDGQPSAPADARDTLLLDPGLHRIRATAAGYRPLELDLKLMAGSTREIELKFEPEAAPPTSSRDSGKPSTPSAAPISKQPTRSRLPTNVVASGTLSAAAPTRADVNSGRTQRAWGWVSGGTGVALLGVAGYFVWRTQTFVNSARADNHCDASFSCDAVGMDKLHSAERAQLQGIVAGVGGAVLVGTGIALLVTEPRRSQQSAALPLRLVVTAAGSSLEGAF
jgi:hypothetical protein